MADLLGSVIAAHGGLDRWRTVRAIDVTFNFSGGLLDLKGYPGHHRPSVSVNAATPRTVFQRLGDESDDRWIFTANRVGSSAVTVRSSKSAPIPARLLRGMYAKRLGIACTLRIFSAMRSGTISQRPSSLLGRASPHESSRRMSKVAKPGASSR